MRLAVVSLVVLLTAAVALAEVAQEKPTIEPLVRAVDLNVGQEQTVVLCDGSKATVKLLDLKEHRDALRNAVRKAEVTVVVNGEKAVLTSATYHLPRVVGGVQIDCPVTKGHVQPKLNHWSLDADARLRLWPTGSPWIQPGTFRYPVRQRWFASYTLMANQIGDGEEPAKKPIYYHCGLDFGGAERMVDVLAATDGVVVAGGEKLLGSGPYPDMLKPRYDVVYLRDGRGWYYRYSHLDSIDPAMTLGARVKMGQKIGVLGKEGASGGWSHLHFDINAPAAQRPIRHRRRLRLRLAGVPRAAPHAARGRRPAASGRLGRRHGHARRQPLVERPRAGRDAASSGRSPTEPRPPAPRSLARYAKPGEYSEIVKVTDREGRVDYDFAVVGVMDRNAPSQKPPGLHAAYWPTLGIQPGDEITFKVRAFGLRADEGHDTWDFGDGSPTATTQSDGNADPHVEERLRDHDAPLREAGPLPGHGPPRERPRRNRHGLLRPSGRRSPRPHESGQGSLSRQQHLPRAAGPKLAQQLGADRQRSRTRIMFTCWRKPSRRARATSSGWSQRIRRSRIRTAPS